MMRRLAKDFGCGLLAWSGLARLVEELAGAGLPLVVGYHRVVDDLRDARGIPGMCVSSRTFERHVDWLARHTEIVSLDAIAERLVRRRSCAGVSAITFDDGYADVHEHALPILARKGLPAAMFVATDYIDSVRLHLHDRLYMLLEASLRQGGAGDAARAEAHGLTRALLATLPRAELERIALRLGCDVALPRGSASRLRCLTWRELGELQRSGFTIGSHTRSHAILTAEPEVRLAAEARGSRLALERRVGTPVRDFAYPDGAFAPRAVRAIAGAGYRLGFGTCRHRDGRRPHLTVPRRLLWEGSTTGAAGGFSAAIMRCHAAGVLRADRCARSHA